MAIRITKANPRRAVAAPAATPKPPKSKLALKEKNVKKPSQDPPVDNINQYPYYAGPDPISGWSVDLLASALAQHQRGMFQQSGILAEDMAANPWINHCLERRSEFFRLLQALSLPLPG